MRIIAGTFRGRRLAPPHDRSIRPTTDRTKQSVFDMLATRIDFDGIGVLDLFSGTGSLGLEALSRGAGHATFVDTNRSSLDLLEKNIRLLNCESQTTIHQADVFWYLKNAGQPVDLVFVDPPFALMQIGTLPTALARSRVLKHGTYVVMEHSKESAMHIPEDSFTATHKMFGQTAVLILHAVSGVHPEDLS